MTVNSYSFFYDSGVLKTIFSNYKINIGNVLPT